MALQANQVFGAYGTIGNQLGLPKSPPPTSMGGTLLSNGTLNPATTQPQPTYAAPTNFGAAPTPQVYYNSTGAGFGSQALADQSSAAIGAYDQGIGNVNSAIGRLGGQLDIGNRNIDTGYNSALNTLNQTKANNQQSYDTGTQQNKQGYVTNKATIGSQVGSNTNSLLRLLGSRGAGGSSAALYGAPQAVAHQGAIQNAGAGQNYAQNAQNLDTNWNQYLQGYGNSMTDLGNQRTNQQHALQGQIDSTRATLLQNLANLTSQRTQAAGGSGAASVAAAQPFLNQANDYLGQADQLGLNVPTYQVAPTTYTAPSLSSYTADPGQVQTNNPNSLTDSITPYLSLLLGRNRQANPTGAI